MARTDFSILALFGTVLVLVSALPGCDQKGTRNDTRTENGPPGQVSRQPLHEPDWGTDPYDPVGLPMKHWLCGDGYVDPRESCDDGNIEGGDGCGTDCRIEGGRCGDGVWNQDEECDDGNATARDGCDLDCRIEPSRCDGMTCDYLSDVPVDFPAMTAIPAGLYAIGNQALREHYKDNEAISALAPAQIALAGFDIETAPTGPMTWREANTICQRRERRLPGEEEWEAAFRLNTGDGSDLPNPLGLDFGANPSAYEWTATGMVRSEDPEDPGARVWNYFIIKNVDHAAALRMKWLIDRDPLPGEPDYPGRETRLPFRCVK